jgi:hypothetical protein
MQDEDQDIPAQVEGLSDAQGEGGHSVKTFYVQMVNRKGEKSFPAVECPVCGKWAHWQGVPSYTRNARVMITYACVEDDGCGAIGSRPLREGGKV